MKIIKNITADEIKKSILKLAIQGKLVKQNLNDEPASELIKKIYKEKQNLINEGKIKKDKDESYIFKGDDNYYYEKIGNNKPKKLENLPFNIPNNWIWTKQKNICWLSNGVKVKGKKLPYLEAKVIRRKQSPSFLEEGVVITPYQKIILVDGENSGEIMSPPFEGYMGSTFKILSSTSFFNFDYLIFIFAFNKDLYKNSKIGAAIPHLNKNIFKENYIAIPPLEEQQRIVDKINLLEFFIKQYHEIEQKLSKLENEFPEKLKKSVLQYAMQGKLIKQDPNDDSIKDLLKQIHKEKQKLYKEGKLKKKDLEESIIYKSDDKSYYEKIGNNKPKKLENLPFNIPNNWVWIRFNQLVHYYMGKTPERIIKEYWNSDFPWITISDIKNDNFLKKTKESISILAKDTLFKNKVSPIGTLIMSFKLTIGNVSILDINATHNEAIISIFPFFDTSNVIRNFLFKFLPLISNNGNAKDAIKGKTLNSNSINNLLIPLPPLKEQERIVYNLENINKLITKITTN